jgi:hypothetical protein
MIRRWFLPVIAVVAAAAITAGVVHLMPATRDGSTPRRAVVLDVPKDKINDEEYAWMAKHYPGYSLPDEVFHQMRGGDDGWVYSYYYIDTTGGRREVWFYTGIRDK